MQLAIATYTPISWWFEADDEMVLTAIDVLNEMAEGA